MNTHTLEQLEDPPNAGAYAYPLSHYGHLLMLKHRVEVLHSTPNAVSMALAKRRQPRARGGRPLSSAKEDADSAIASTWAGSSR